MQKSVLVLKEMQMVVNQDGTAGMQYGIGPKGAGAGAGGPAPDTSWRNYARNLFARPGQGPGLMNRLKGAAGLFGGLGALAGGAFAGMDALANASQSNSLTGALNAPTSALMAYQGLNPASYMSMPPTYRGPAASRTRTETPDIGTAIPHELQGQQTAEVEDTPDIEEHAENALIGTVGHPQEMDKIIESAKEGHGATTPSHTPAPTETKKPTGSLGDITSAAETTPPSMVDSSLANQPVGADVGAAVDTYTDLNQQGKMGEGSSWQNALKVLDKTPAKQLHPSIPQAGDLPAGQIQGDTGWGLDENWGEDEEEDWRDIRTGFVPAFMEVYGDLLKGMSPHDVGIFASEVFLKMR